MIEKLFSEELKRWRGSLYQKEAAAKLDIPLPSYRKYENGKRTPNKLAIAELRRRMWANEK
jgi:Helix-turn-helix